MYDLGHDTENVVCVTVYVYFLLNAIQSYCDIHYHKMLHIQHAHTCTWVSELHMSIVCNFREQMYSEHVHECK